MFLFQVIMLRFYVSWPLGGEADMAPCIWREWLIANEDSVPGDFPPPMQLIHVGERNLR